MLARDVAGLSGRTTVFTSLAEIVIKDKISELKIVDRKEYPPEVENAGYTA